MSRPLRIQYEGACYHVISRGNRREVVFLENSDCELFLEKLVEFSEFYEVVIYSYCLMPNHFHLHIRTRHANLSKFMQSFLTSFTITMNRKHGKSGHLFQGRYKAQLVQSELYKNKLSRYIHLNPVKIKSLEEASSAVVLQRLKSYKWSSYHSYIGLAEKPKWLDRRFVLSSWGKSSSDKIANYREYVEQGIVTDNSGDVSGHIGNSIMGSEEFKDEIISDYLHCGISDIDSREQPLLSKINAVSPEEILTFVISYYKLGDMEKITVRRESCREARKIAMYLIRKQCRKGQSLTSLAKIFGLKISGFNTACDKFKNELGNNSDIRNAIKNISKNIKTEV